MDARIVALHKQAAARADVINLAGGLPADELLPRAALARAFVETAADPKALQYGWVEGIPALREWVAARLVARGANVRADRIIITAGAQQALALCGALLRGQKIAVGDAAYPGAIDAFASAGARVVVEGGDAHYVMAGVSNPHGIAVAAPASGTLIVDEAYAELRFDGYISHPLVGADVWHIGTISKTIAPGLRIGWLVPPQQHYDAVLALKQAADLQTASVTQAAFARLLAAVDYDALVDRARACYAQRAAILVDALRSHGLHFTEPQGGFSIWVELDEPCDEVALARRALAEGVMFDPGCMFRPAPGPAAIRLSYSNASIASLVDGARRLARTLTVRPLGR
jgi:2-aminoadipate transaminase